jgi:AhpD family alkylhydroperoxidase
MQNTTAHDGIRVHSSSAESTGPSAERLDVAQVAPAAMRAMLGLEQYVRRSSIESSLRHLVYLRTSITNGCAYCVDMHTKDARVAGETEQRLYAVAVWRETPFFTPRERAALAWADELTEIGRTGASDEAFAEARSQFSEEELVDLTMVVNTISGWNRLAISFRKTVGSYVVAASGAVPD